MSNRFWAFWKGIILKPESTDPTDNVESSIWTNGTSKRIKAYLDSAVRTVVTEDQSQTIENKTIDGTDASGNNTISADASDITYDPTSSGLSATTSQAAVDEVEARVEVNESEISDAQTQIDNHEDGAANKHDATEIDIDPAITNLDATDAQAAFAEIQGDIDSLDTDSHTHSNKVILDATEASFLTADETKVDHISVTGAVDLDTIESDTSSNNDHRAASSSVHGITGDVVGTDDIQDVSNKAIITPSRSDVRQGTESDCADYAAGTGAYAGDGAATNGQLCFATDVKKMYQVIDGTLEAVGGGGGTVIEIEQAAHALAVGNGIYHNGTSWAKAQADANTTLSTYVVTEVIDVDNFVAYQFGRVELTAHGLGAAGEYHFLSSSVAGATTTTEPTSGYSCPLFYIESVDIIQVMAYRPAAVGNTVSLDELDDVDAPSPTNAQVLTFNNSSGNWEPAEASAGSDSINYNENNYDVNIVGVSTSDAVNLAISSETSNPLIGAGSLKITKAASDQDADYVTLRQFTVETIHQDPTVMEVDFGYKISDISGSYSDGDLAVYIYDVTNATSISVTPEDVMANSLSSKFFCEFQTSAAGSVYEVRMRVNNTNVNSFSILIDGYNEAKWYVGPQRGKTSGPVISDEKDLNVTLTNFGNAVATISKYWRVGSLLHGNIEVTIGNGLPTGALTVALDDFSIDVSGGVYKSLGEACVAASGTLNDGKIWYSTSNSFIIFGDDSGGLWNGTFPVLLEEGDRVYYNFSVPIAGWSSNQVMSSESSSREISARYFTPALTIPTGLGNRIDFNTRDYDTTSSVTTGASWQYKVPEAGLYSIKCFIRTGATAAVGYTAINVGGTKDFQIVRMQDLGIHNTIQGSVELRYNKDDIIYMTTDLQQAGSLAGEYANFSIHKIQSPQQIAASEKVYGFANSSSQSIPYNTQTAIIFDTTVDDSHSIMNTTTGAITSPKSGILTLSVNYQYNGSSAWTVDDVSVIYLIIDGVTRIEKFIEMPTGIANTIAISDAIAISGISVKQGDVIEVKLLQNNGGALAILLSPNSTRTTCSWIID